AGLEGDPRQPGRDQLVPLLDRDPLARPPRVPAPVQPLRRHARARLHLAAVRGAADLRLPGDARPAAARGCERPGRAPSLRVPAHHAAAGRAGALRSLPVRLHPHARRVRHALARRRRQRLPVRQPDRRPVPHRLPRLGDGLGAGALPSRRGRDPHARLLAVPAAAPGGDRLMDVALSRTGAWILRAFFALVVVFLYAPIVILLIFSFNDSEIPTFPLSGFTLHWYYEFVTNADLRNALQTSAIVAALSSLVAVALGVLA